MSKPKVLVMLYPNCISFEIMLAIEILGTQFFVDVVTTDNDIHTDVSGLQIKPNTLFEQLRCEDYKLLIIPGGNPDAIVGSEEVRKLVKSFYDSELLVAGICAGVLVLADSGILQGHKITHNYTSKYAPAKVVELTSTFWDNTIYEEALCVISENIITAMPNGYIDFATQLAEQLGVYTSKDAEQMNCYYKGSILEKSISNS